MQDQEFIQTIQSRAARIAVGPSAVRGRGHGGVSKAAREYLRAVRLSRFGTHKKHIFLRALDDGTEGLRLSLPKSAQKWGLARKIINIFLRDCAYTSYLADEYNLMRAEYFFEIPLDSITARALKKSAGRGKHPSWPGVVNVTQELNSIFQVAAQTEAKQFGIARLHLDALWWASSRDKSMG
jgi:hypothetical protein